MLQTDIRHDVVRSFYRPLAELDAGDVDGVFAELEAEGAALLEREGIGGRATATSPARPTCATSARSTRSTSRSARRSSLERDRRASSTTRTASATGTRRPARRSSSSTCGSRRWDGSRRREAPYPAPPDEEADPCSARATVVVRRRRARDAGAPCATGCGRASRHEGPVVIEEQSSTTVVPPGTRRGARRARQPPDHES